MTSVGTKKLTLAQTELLQKREAVRGPPTICKYPFPCSWCSLPGSKNWKPIGTCAVGVRFEGAPENAWVRFCCTEQRPCFTEYNAYRAHMKVCVCTFNPDTHPLILRHSASRLLASAARRGIGVRLPLDRRRIVYEVPNPSPNPPSPNP